jgi:hypothetical protein
MIFMVKSVKNAVFCAKTVPQRVGAAIFPVKAVTQCYLAATQWIIAAPQKVSAVM